MTLRIFACPRARLAFFVLFSSSAAWSAPPHSSPTLSFAADKAEYAAGESAELTWSSTDTKFCNASGDWSGKLGTSGRYRTPPLDGSKQYTLDCHAPGGGVTQTLNLAVSAPSEPAPAEPAPAPVVSLSASSNSIDSGGSATLTWSATDADSCTASGGWSGSRAVSGSESVSPASDTTYTLTCTGDGGSDSASTAVSVNEVTVPPPTLSLSVADTSVPNGSSTTLSWSSQNADSCTASGGWSGTRATTGSESVGPLSAATTFSLSCSGPSGTVVEMLSVSVISETSISWQPPTENVDGSPLTDLVGYRLYYGTSSGAYTETVEISDAAATSYRLSLGSGSYVVVMTAVDADGQESAYSNEIVKEAP